MQYLVWDLGFSLFHACGAANKNFLHVAYKVLVKTTQYFSEVFRFAGLAVTYAAALPYKSLYFYGNFQKENLKNENTACHRWKKKVINICHSGPLSFI